MHQSHDGLCSQDARAMLGTNRAGLPVARTKAPWPNVSVAHVASSPQESLGFVGLYVGDDGKLLADWHPEKCNSALLVARLGIS